MNSKRTLNDKETRDLLSPPDEVVQANLRHDALYGWDYTSVKWRCAFEPASRHLDRESIWAWHRERERMRAMNLGLKIIAPDS